MSRSCQINLSRFSPINLFRQRLPGSSILLISMLLVTMNVSALELPTGRVVLQASGNISVTNVGETAQFDLKMLEKLPMTSFVSTTPWTENTHRWEGVLMSDFLRYIGAGSQSFRASALDDYHVQVEGIDFSKYPIILALKRDGKRMRIRDKGPIWLMFPWDDYPEIHNDTNVAFSVWQLSEIRID